MGSHTSTLGKGFIYMGTACILQLEKAKNQRHLKTISYELKKLLKAFLFVSTNTMRLCYYYTSQEKSGNQLVGLHDWRADSLSSSKTNGGSSPSVMLFPSLPLKMSDFITELSDLKSA